MEPNPVSFELQADLCLALGHPTRLRMLRLLKNGPRCVNEIAKQLEINQPTASRHLTVLRQAGILAAQRQGNDMMYRIANPKIIDVCDLMRAVLAKRESRRSEILQEFAAESADGRLYAT